MAPGSPTRRVISIASEWAVKQLKSGAYKMYILSHGATSGQGGLYKNLCGGNNAVLSYRIAYPFAWTKGTGGPIKAEVMQIPALDPDVVKVLATK